MDPLVGKGVGRIFGVDEHALGFNVLLGSVGEDGFQFRPVVEVGPQRGRDVLQVDALISLCPFAERQVQGERLIDLALLELVLNELALVHLLMRDLHLRLVLADGRPPRGFVHVQLRQEVIEQNLFVAFQRALEEQLLVFLIFVGEVVEDVRDVGSGEVPALLAGEDMQDLEDVLALQQDPPDLCIHRDDVHDGLPVLLRGGPDDVVAVDELRVVRLVDALVDRLEGIVEHLFVAILIEIVEELVQLRQQQLVIVLLDEREELLLVVLLFLELEDVVDVLDERQLSTV